MIELKHLRTERTATFHVAGDEYKQQCWASDRFYDNWRGLGDGEKGWRQCDPVITPVPGVRAEHVDYQDDGWRVDFMPYVAWFPQFADGIFTFQDDKDQKGISYAITAQKAGHVEGKVVDTSVVYPDAYGPGADLVYALMASGVSKLVQIAPDSAVAGPFEFRFTLPDNSKLLRRNSVDTYEVTKDATKTTDSNRVTVLEISGKETYIAPFTWRAGIGEVGILPVKIDPLEDGFLFTKEIPAEWTREFPLTMDLTATGTTAVDGYFGATSITSFIGAVNASTASTIDLTATENVLWYKKGVTLWASYNFAWIVTNTVDPTASVSKVENTVYYTGVVNAGGFIGVWCELTPITPGAIVVGDWYLAGPYRRAISWGDIAVGAINTTATTVLVGAGLTAFNKNGRNTYCAREKTNDLPASAYTGAAVYVSIGYSENATPGKRPVQTITYTMPVVGSSSPFMLMGVG